MKRISIIATAIVILALLLYKSVYFEKLDVKKQRELVKSFNPKELVSYFWKNKLPGLLKTALPVSTFDSLLKANPDMLIKQYGKTVGISNNSCYLVCGTFETAGSCNGEISLKCKCNYDYKIQTKYIFNNTARDASGFFRADDFQNSMDFNSVSSEINSLILKEMKTAQTDSLPSGTMIQLAGAIEINKESVSREIEMVPYQIKIISKMQ
jgi:predicted lipoprotein